MSRLDRLVPAPPSRSPCSRSTCRATFSATFSIPGRGEAEMSSSAEPFLESQRRRPAAVGRGRRSQGRIQDRWRDDRRVDGVSFSIGPGETGLPRWRIGIPEKSVTSLSLMRLVEFGGGRISGGKLKSTSARGTRSTSPRRRRISCVSSRQSDRHDLPGADDFAQSGLHNRAATRGWTEGASGLRGTTRVRERSSYSAACGCPKPERRLNNIPTNCRAACVSASS